MAAIIPRGPGSPLGASVSSVLRAARGAVAGVSARRDAGRSTLRSVICGPLVRFLVAAVLLTCCVRTVLPMGEHLPRLNQQQFAPAQAALHRSPSTHPVAPRSFRLWLTLRHQRHKPTCSGRYWWLLALVSLCGDVETQPGPAIRLYSQNVNSLKGKLGVMRTYAGELGKHDALCFTETKMAADSPTDSELQMGFFGYSWFRKYRDINGGGVACAVKTSLLPVHRPDLETACESLVVQVGTTNTALLAVCYRPPDADRQMEKVADLLRGLHRTGLPYLMTGDINLPEVSWTTDGEAAIRRCSARAITFLDAVSQCEAQQPVTSPTRGDNFLDLVVSRGGRVTSNVQEQIFPSDHQAIETHFFVDAGRTARVTRSRVYNYKRADFAGLRRALGNLPWTVLEAMDVDSAVSTFYDFVFAAVHDHIPTVELRHSFPPWFDRSVRNLLRDKELAHRRRKANPSAENIELHSKARAEFKRQADRSYREYLMGLVRDFRVNAKRYRTFIKSLKCSAHVPPVLKWGGALVKDVVARANCFNACFAEKFSEPYTGPLPEAPVLNTSGISEFEIPDGRVAQLLRELSPHKACGPDGLSARILKECADELAVPLEMICRLSVRSGVFPSAWKQANVIPVHKKGSKKLPTNYRPVSLLAICSKILEKVVCESLVRSCLPALPSSQHGFVQKRSCLTNLACFTEHCWGSLADGLQTDAIYTDFSSAFTSVSHRLLLFKLRHSFNVTGLAFSWLESYLSHRMQRVVIDGKHSDWIRVLSGVPEGSILGPALFTCYVADLPNQIKTNILSYADDVKNFHKIRNKQDADSLQADLNWISEWSKTWLLKLNPAKCKSITFTLRSSPISSSYVLDGHRLEKCGTIRDLGVILDSKLTFASHVDITMAKANRMLGLLMRSMQTAPGVSRLLLDHRPILCAYKAHVRSVLEYGSVIWAGAAVTHLRRFERLQHRFLMWLAVTGRGSCPQLDYKSLLEHFKCPSIKSRIAYVDITFVKSVFHGRIDCPEIVAMFGLLAPSRRTRHSGLLHAPFGRVNSVKNGFLVRIPSTVNAFFHEETRSDLFHPVGCIKADIVRYADSLGTYLD